MTLFFILFLLAVMRFKFLNYSKKAAKNFLSKKGKEHKIQCRKNVQNAKMFKTSSGNPSYFFQNILIIQILNRPLNRRRDVKVPLIVAYVTFSLGKIH